MQTKTVTQSSIHLDINVFSITNYEATCTRRKKMQDVTMAETKLQMN